jgi:hypothetical protein
MTDALPPVYVPLLEKAAVDNGFDLGRAREGDWLSFESSHAPLRVWLTVHPGPHFLVGLSRLDVAHALEQGKLEAPGALPPGAIAARAVADLASLHRLVRRAFQLARTLPDELLHVFEAATAALPKATEAERLVVQRVGQNVFRKGLLDYWESRCAITGLGVVELLRASHIKPWADCTSDAERLDVFNGLLLAPHLDAAFDRGFITITDDGSVVVSDTLGEEDRHLLVLDRPLRIRNLADGHRAYLPWHRERVFDSSR